MSRRAPQNAAQLLRELGYRFETVVSEEASLASFTGPLEDMVGEGLGPELQVTTEVGEPALRRRGCCRLRG